MIRPKTALACVALAGLVAAQETRIPTPGGDPEAPFRGALEAIEEAVERGDVPGAVLLVGRGEEELALRAFGNRSEVPRTELMTAGTVFDLASLTKPVATATAVMLLVQRGELDLDRPVAGYLPAFGQEGKEAITSRMLLLHRGGLIADNPLADYLDGPELAWDRICALRPVHPPGEKFLYTDVGFIVLGELVRAIDGRPLDEFFAAEIAAPLGLGSCGFGAPPEEAAPTEVGPDGRPFRGVVHDPRARALGGVAGHAGLFGSARDVAGWCRMMLGLRTDVLGAAALEEMTRASWLPGGTGGRGLGLDVDTGYSSPRGALFPRGRSFGHTGFTGTSVWVDPASGVFVVLLTNRVHPDGQGKTVALRARVATEVARALLVEESPAPVLTGADVLAREGAARLRGKRVGLLTNHTGRTREGRGLVDVLASAEGVDLRCIFTPEHGFLAALEGDVPDGVDPETGLPVHSLYGETRRPTPAMLEGLDLVVFDLPDVGVRFYTYATTLGYLMEVAGSCGVGVVVLDRPNPLGGLMVDGPAADPERRSFICYQSIPVVHGLTMGELAHLWRDAFGVACEVEVVTMEGWRRDMSWPDTGLEWVPPSPNLRNPAQSVLYPAIGLLEGTNVSVGRGTDEPFERLGAPWIDGTELAAELERLGLPGLRVTPLSFTPQAATHEGQACGGVHLELTRREDYRPIQAGLIIAWALNRLYPRDFEVAEVDDRLMNHAVWEAMMRGEDPADLHRAWADDVASFRRLRQASLLYR